MGAIFFGSFLFFCIGPSGPDFFPYVTLDDADSGVASDTSILPIDERFFNFDGYFQIYNVEITEDDSACSSSTCNPIEYETTVQVN